MTAPVQNNTPITPAPTNHSPTASANTSLSAVMALIIDGLTLHQQNLKTLASQLNQNASVQMFWNDANKRIHYAVVSANATNGEIERVQDENRNFDAQRQNIEDLLITLRQNSHVSMTQASAETNAVSQSAAQVSFTLRTWASEAQVIIQMTGQGQ